MPDSRIFRFYDYYEAYRFAQQLEDEGHRAEIHEFVYGLAPFSTPEVRVVAFEDGLARDPEEGEDALPFGELELGRAGRDLDEGLRLIAASAMCLTLPLGIYVAVKDKLRLPPPTLELFALTLLCAAILFAGAAASIAAYRGYRADRPGSVLVIHFGALLAFVGVFDLNTGFFSLLLFHLSGGRWYY